MAIPEKSQSATPFRRNNVRICFYFVTWFFLAFSAALFDALNIDWDNNPKWLAVLLVVVTCVLQGSVLELVVMAITTAVLGGHIRQPLRAPFEHLTLIMNYNLLAVSEDDIDETFRTMYEAYMNNVSENISTVLVSATADIELKAYELRMRDKYRQRIYKVLMEEGLNFYNGNVSFIPPLHLKYLWKKYENIPKIKFFENLQIICSKFSREFMCVHRVCRVLKKCGQYQDLMLLSEGDNYGFSYTDGDYYGKTARKYGQPLFHDSDDVKNIQGRKFDYTLVLDGDTGVSQGTAYELLEVAAANPQRGIIQPAIKMNVQHDDTLFMYLESIRQQVNDPITNALTDLLGQSGFYGKGLIQNRVYIEHIIGSRNNVLERVPIDVLSHDTFEAACLRPLYASNIFLLEAPCLNYVTWDMRETRWNKGEILLSMYFWPNTVGRLFRHLQRKFQGDSFVHTKMRTPTTFDFVSSYVAHSALRNMFMKPLLLVFMFLHMFVKLRYPKLPIVIIMFLIMIFPKMAVYNGYNFKKIIIDILGSVFQFTPEAFVGTVRLLRAIQGNITVGGRWVPQRAVEEEFKNSNSFVSSWKHLWKFSTTALVLFLIVEYLDMYAANRNYLMFSMIGTLFFLPLFTAFTSLPCTVLNTLDKKRAKVEPVSRKVLADTKKTIIIKLKHLLMLLLSGKQAIRNESLILQHVSRFSDNTDTQVFRRQFSAP